MAKSKKPAPAKEETFLEKVSHKIGDIADTVVEKYNDIVHAGEKEKMKKAHPRTVSKTSGAKKPVPKKSAAAEKVAKKTAAKKAMTAAAKKAAPKKTAAKKKAK